MKTFNIRKSILICTGYVYLSLPLVIWAAGWLRPFFCSMFIISAAVGIFFACRAVCNKFCDEVFELKITSIVFIASVALIWTWISGIGGFYYQSVDYHWRNAMFRDLINYPWPVHYGYGASFVYYFGMFLPAALVGKVFGWTAGCLSLYLYFSLGMSLLLFLAVSYLKCFSGKSIIIAVLCIVFFSGMDAPGVFVHNFVFPQNALTDHLEWWALNLQYSSNMTLYMWVFNQALPLWIATVLFLYSDVNLYGVIVVLCALYSPYAMFGLTVCALALIISRLCAGEKPMDLLKKLFSIPNILFVFMVFPAEYLFITSNITVSGSGFSFFGDLLRTKYLLFTVLFMLLEFFILMLLLFAQKKRDPIYWAVMLQLFVFPFIRLGHSIDFCMRATIPALFILTLMTAERLLCIKKPVKFRDSLIILCLIIGLVTPVTEQKRAVNSMQEAGLLFLRQDRLVTFGNEEGIEEYYYLLHYDDSENFFWTVLARENKL